MKYTVQGRTRRPQWKFFILLLLLVILSSTITLSVTADNSEPILSRGKSTPSIGRPNIEYLFTVTYTDSDNDAPSYVKVFIDEVDYEMEEVDSADTNYMDGKDYFFRSVLGEGTYNIHFEADDGNGSVVDTKSFTLDVTWDVGHYDIIHFVEEEIFPGIMLGLTILVIILIVLCIIAIYMGLQLRKIAKKMKGMEKGESEDITEEREGIEDSERDKEED